MNLQTLLRAGKAHVALIGAVLTYIVAHYPDGPWVPYVSAALAILTAAGVYTAPRTYGEKPTRHKDAGYGAVELLVVIILVIILIGVLTRWH